MTDHNYEVLTLGYDHHWYAGTSEKKQLGKDAELARILNEYGEAGWSVVAACGDARFRQVILTRDTGARPTLA